MVSNKRKNIILLIAYALLLLLFGVLAPKEIDWTPTFSSSDKIPYGDYILKRELKSIFQNSPVEENHLPFYNFYDLRNSQVTGLRRNFIIINEALDADTLDIRSMLGFVRSGSNVFIASDRIPSMLEDSLGLRISPVPVPPEYLQHQKGSGEIGHSDHFNFTNKDLKTDKGYEMRKSLVSWEILNSDSVSFSLLKDEEKPAKSERLKRIVLGKNDEGKENFVQVPFGRGNFFIHAYPLAFTNYEMLKDKNNEYVAKCLSYLPDNNTYWDEYYKPFGHLKPQTPLRFILSVPAYKWAYYTAIFSILFYVIFAAKREQRVIPVITPFKNLSLEFARTIGSLYYSQKDHRDLAKKKMTYLLEKVRNHYLLPTAKLDEGFREKLAYKSNVPLETIRELFNFYLIEIQDVKNISEKTLIVFNKMIEKFYIESGLSNK